MSGISTHVLDVTRGIPAANVPVVLEHEVTAGDWRMMTNTRTDDDGRVKELLPPGTTLAAGAYRLRFETGAYWAQAQLECFHPRVEVTFTVTNVQRHHHVPLLMSPFGYTTYRGT